MTRILAAFLTFMAITNLTFAQTPSREAMDKAVIEHDKANVAMMKKDNETAYTHLKNAVELDPTNSSFLNSTAYMAMQMGEPEKAIDYLDMALELDKQQYGDDHPNVASVINNKASVYSSMGNHEKAVEHYKKAYDIVVGSLGEKHPQAELIKNLLDKESAK